MSSFRVASLSLVQNLMSLLKGLVTIMVFENSILGQIDLYKTAFSSVKNIDLGISSWARALYKKGDEPNFMYYSRIDSFIVLLGGAILLGSYAIIYSDKYILLLLLLIPIQQYSKYLRFLKGTDGKLHLFITKELIGSVIGLILLYISPSFFVYFFAIGLVLMTTVWPEKGIFKFLWMPPSELAGIKRIFRFSSRFAILSWSSLAFLLVERYAWVELVGFEEIGKCYLLLMVLSISDGLGTNLAMKYYTLKVSALQHVLLRGIVLSVLLCFLVYISVQLSEYFFLDVYRDNMERLNSGLLLMPCYFFSGFIGYMLTKHVSRAPIYISVLRLFFLIGFCFLVIYQEIIPDLVMVTRLLFVLPVIVLTLLLWRKSAVA